jgi:hypothetical protein
MIRRAPVVVVAVAISVGCSYSWGIAPGPIDDASADVRLLEAGMDVSADASHEDGSATDAVDGAVTDTQPPSDGPSCNDLLQAVDTALAAAKKCLGGTDCQSSTLDQCMCKVFVAQAGNQATSDYITAVHALQDAAGCLNCAQCPPPPTQSLCLVGPMPMETTCQP